MEHQNQTQVFARRKKVSWMILSVLIILSLIVVAYYFLVYRYFQSTDNAYVKADVTWIVPRIAAEVATIEVKENQYVKKGDVLFTLDDRDYQARYDQAVAQVDAKQANLRVQKGNQYAAEAKILEAKAQLRATQAEVTRLSEEYQRYEELMNDGVITRQHFESIQAQYSSAKAQRDNAQSAVAAATAQVASVSAEKGRLSADVENAKASLALYEIERHATTIVSPVDGKVGALSVQLGSRVTPQSRLIAIVPDKTIYVEANYKETQIEKMHIGQLVKLQLDAYPNQEFQGKIESFSPASGAVFTMMPPDNATGNFNKVVQRIPVRIALEDNPNNDVFRPGLSVVATVDVRS